MAGDPPEVAKAAEAYDGKGKRVLITLWKDKSLTVCAGRDRLEEEECYFAESNPSNEALYYVAEAHYASLGFRIKTLSDEA